MRIGSARRLGRSSPALAVHLIQALRPSVVRRQRVVIDRPRRRQPIDVLGRLEVLAPQSIQHAAPELGVSADAVVGVRTELTAALVQPALLRPVPQILPDGLGIPVLGLLRDESPRSSTRILAPVSARACAIVPPPAPVPIMTMSTCSVRIETSAPQPSAPPAPCSRRSVPSNADPPSLARCSYRVPHRL